MKHVFGSYGTMGIILALGILTVLFSSTRSVSGTERDETSLGNLVQYVDGDILIAVYVPISYDDMNNNKGPCNRHFAHPEMAEQVNMFLKEVNNDAEILPGVKLGAVVINSCKSGYHSFVEAYEDFMNPYIFGYSCIRSFCPQGQRILAGVVGPPYSYVSMAISTLTDTFDIPQVSYGSTSTELSDKEWYKTFFRTVPSNSIQAKAMAHFIAKMEWNYVGIVYTDDAYGNDGFQEISKHFKNKGICIAEIAISNDVDDNGVSSVLDKIDSAAKAVILFVHAPVARKILSVAAKRSNTKSITWIASDKWATMSLDDGYKDAVHGTIGFSPKFPSMEKVNKRMQDLTILDYTWEKAILNPWWQEYLKRTKNCSTRIGAKKRLCNANERIPEYHASPNGLDDAMSVFVHALHKYHKKTCNAARGLCDELARKAGTNDVAKDLIPYIKDTRFLTADERLIKFDENGDGPPLYDIFAFDKDRPKSLSNGWRIVGSYDDKHGVFIDKQELPEKVRHLRSRYWWCL